MREETFKFFGTYAGIVVDTKDPEKVGRIKVRVPVLHGFSGSGGGLVEDKDLPWAFASGLPAGGSAESGGLSWIPVKGDSVWVRFLDGDLSKAIWEWGSMTLPQAKKYGQLPLHSYEDSGLPTRRSAAMRFDHWNEIIPSGHDIWTKNGYHFEVNDGASGQSPQGFFSWTTAAGFLVKLDDATETITRYATNIEDVCTTTSIAASKNYSLSAPTIEFNFGSMILGGSYSGFNIDAASASSMGLSAQFNSLALSMSGAMNISASSFSIGNGGFSVNRSSNTASPSGKTGFGVDGDVIGIGYDANDPVVRLSDLVRALETVKKVFDEHVHIGVSSGRGQSGVPSIQAGYTAYGSAKVSIEPTSRSSKNVV